MKPYISQAPTQHLREEENVWVKILKTGETYSGIILLYSQKLCTAAHEISSATHEEKVNITNIPFYGKRLRERLKYLVKLLEDSETYFECLKDFKDLETTLEFLITNPSEKFYEIPEKIHLLTHQLSDELTKSAFK